MSRSRSMRKRNATKKTLRNRRNKRHTTKRFRTRKNKYGGGPNITVELKQIVEDHNDNGPFNLAQAISGMGRGGVDIKKDKGHITGTRIVEILQAMNLLSDEADQGLPLDQYVVRHSYSGLELKIPLADWTRITGLTRNDVRSIIDNYNTEAWEGSFDYYEDRSGENGEIYITEFSD